MLTRRTPDLTDPVSHTDSVQTWKSSGYETVTTHANGALESASFHKEDLAFWPRTLNGVPGGKGDVEFKWTIDDDHTPVVSNLLFVSNSLVNNEDAIRTIAAYYRDIGGESATPGGAWPALRTARLFGTRRRYASATSKFDPSFDTDSWLLSLRGQIDVSTGLESFPITSTLIRADQPPIYPVVAKAKIAVQSLDRLLGSPQGLVEFQFYPPYVASGFKADDNSGELFLQALYPTISLDVNNNGGATGALARPNSVLTALSRTTGLVGGKWVDKAVQVHEQAVGSYTASDILGLAIAQTTAPSPPASPSPLPIGQQPYPSNLVFPGARDGHFDPSEFFHSTAKLLGLVKLSDLLQIKAPLNLEMAPKLLETVGFGPLNGSAAWNKVREILKDTTEQLSGFETAINNAISSKTADQPMEVQAKLSFASLYPTAASAITAFDASVKRLAENNDIGKAPSELADVFTSGSDLVSALQRLIDDPIPQLAKVELDVVSTLVSQLDIVNTSFVTTQITPLADRLTGFAGVFLEELDKVNLRNVLVAGALDLAQDSAERVQDRASIFVHLVGTPLARCTSLLKEGLSGQAGLSAEAVCQAVQSTLQNATDLSRYLQVALAGSLTKDWTQASKKGEGARVVVFVHQLAAEMTSTGIRNNASTDGPDLSDRVKRIGELFSTLKVESEGRKDLEERLNKLGTEFKSSFDSVNNHVQELRIALTGSPQNLGLETVITSFDAHSFTLYRNVDLLLSSVNAVFVARQSLVQTATEIGNVLPAIDAVFRDAPDENRRNTVLQISKECAGIVLGATGIEAIAAKSPAWKAVDRDAEYIGSKIGSPFKDIVSALKEHLAADAGALYAEVGSPNISIEGFSQISPKVRNYSEAEAVLASFCLQSVTLPPLNAARLLSECVQLLVDCGRLYGAVVLQIINLVRAIKDRITSDSLLIVLIGTNAKDQIDSLLVDLNKYLDLVNRITDYGSRLPHTAGTFDAAKASELSAMSINLAAAIEPVLGGDNARTFPVLAHIVEKLTEILREGVRTNLVDRWTIVPQVRQAVSRLQTAMSQIVPTSTSLTYKWKTQLQEHRNDDGIFNFAMTSTTERDSDFYFDSNVSVDFISGRRTWQTTSGLNKFSITVNLERKDLITLYFNGAKFISSQGSEPRTEVLFDRVELGAALEFLKELQKLMSPSEGSGPYILASQQEVTAGYRFDIGVIQVGTLQFLNVSLNVFTTIPLRGSGGDHDLAAQVGFGFGSAARPFLIAQPPYGGGGYVELAYRNNRLKPKISLSFGAVVGINFGPLHGWGRVTSTVTWSDDLIRASVEAVGEGHLGCFGIAVMLQIGLTQQKGGADLVGSAQYSFSFSVGFLSISFSFTVSWTISGGSGSQSQAQLERDPSALQYGRAISPQDHRSANLLPISLLSEDASASGDIKEAAPCVGTHKISISAPDKTTSWKQYRKRLSMELLN